MVSFSREASKKLYLPLALRAYDTTLNPGDWKAIGYTPIGQISIDHHELMVSLAEEQKTLKNVTKRLPRVATTLRISSSLLTTTSRGAVITSDG